MVVEFVEQVLVIVVVFEDIFVGWDVRWVYIDVCVDDIGLMLVVLL